MRSRADAVELAERVRVLLQLQPSICCRRVGPPKPTQSCTHTIMIIAKTKQKLVAKLVAMHLQTRHACQRHPATGHICARGYKNTTHKSCLKWCCLPPSVSLHRLHNLIQLRHTLGQVGQGLVCIALSGSNIGGGGGVAGQTCETRYQGRQLEVEVGGGGGWGGVFRRRGCDATE